MSAMPHSDRVPQRSEMTRCANNRHLRNLQARREQVPVARKAFQFMRSAFGALEARAGPQVGHDARSQNFTWMSFSQAPSRCVHGNAADIMLSHFNLAGMKSGAQ